MLLFWKRLQFTPCHFVKLSLSEGASLAEDSLKIWVLAPASFVYRTLDFHTCSSSGWNPLSLSVFVPLLKSKCEWQHLPVSQKAHLFIFFLRKEGGSVSVSLRMLRSSGMMKQLWVLIKYVFLKCVWAPRVTERDKDTEDSGKVVRSLPTVIYCKVFILKPGLLWESLYSCLGLRFSLR